MSIARRPSRSRSACCALRDEIEQHLLQLEGRADHERKIRGEVQAHGDAIPPQLVSLQLGDGPLDRLVPQQTDVAKGDGEDVAQLVRDASHDLTEHAQLRGPLDLDVQAHRLIVRPLELDVRRGQTEVALAIGLGEPARQSADDVEDDD
jgi:hypothetical protein